MVDSADAPKNESSLGSVATIWVFAQEAYASESSRRTGLVNVILVVKMCRCWVQEPSVGVSICSFWDTQT